MISSRIFLRSGFGLIIFSCFLLSGCQRQPETKKPVQATVVVRLVHDPEVRALLSSAKERFYIDHGKLLDGTALALELIPELNVPAARRLASGELKAEAWITPLKSLADYANARVAPLGAKQVDCKPLFRTPMVIAAPAQLVSQLHAEDGQVSWNALLEQLRSEGDLSGNNPIGYSHGFPEYSASGPMALTFLARLASGARATDTGSGAMDVTSNDPLSDAVITQLKSWQRLVSHYSMSESYLMERVARSNLKRLYFSLASEQQFKLFQRNQRDTTQPLVGLFPEEGTIWNNYQLCMSDAPWVTPAHRAITSSLVDFFGSAEGQALTQSFSFRTIPSVSTESKPTTSVASETAVIREPVPADLGELSGAQMGEFLTRWSPEIMKPGALMIVLDASGSMEGESLRSAKDSLRNLLPRLSERDDIGLMTFASETKSRLPVGTKLSDIFNSLDSARAVGGSAAYDALKVGIDALSAPTLNGYRRTLLMITDGEGDNSELSLQGIQDYLSSRLARYDINVLIVGLKREGAGFADFEKIARGINGYFKEATAADLVSVIQDAMRNI